MAVLGFDVGGANIKLASRSGYSRHMVFPLWQRANELAMTLRSLIAAAPPPQRIAMTMTGELTDCFRSKQEGVQFIIDAMLTATSLPVHVYLIGDEFASPEVARREYLRAAASNWYGLACHIARMADIGRRRGLLIDVGSTTTDIIPFQLGACDAAGKTDHERLLSGELVYSGALRSPLNGIVRRLEFRGRSCPVMNELYATMLDVNVLLKNIPAGTESEWAADHGGTETAHCVTRVARLLGLDGSMLDFEEARALAAQMRDAQLDMLATALDMVISRAGQPDVVVVSGQGEFTARQLCERAWPPGGKGPERISLTDFLDDGISSCAPAWAIASLAEQWLAAV